MGVTQPVNKKKQFSFPHNLFHKCGVILRTLACMEAELIVKGLQCQAEGMLVGVEFPMYFTH